MVANWDERWRQREGDLEPDPWLVASADLLPVGGACFDIACGRGRNALWLAERGWRVTGIDKSPVGLEIAAREADRKNLNLVLRQQDLERSPHLPVGCCDLLLQFFYLQRSLYPALLAAVRPGGVAVVRTFSLAGPFAAGGLARQFLLNPGELPELFAGWEILRHEEGLEASRKGGSLAGIVARKPA
ncbi:methyltransferase domain-containing protein [Geothermobacter hydrogeniphilus]|uniref:methyltransferase domain-containing protein n=1 Tax=Geothermobacter hydrogeniphilus TaxID=1969733 RepID=UPI001304F4C5|nr:methyltransferase domain-containing protein [Geothermobacter hydrogeniphilus]